MTKAKNFLFLIIFIFISGIAYAKEQYTCPMHPHYISDKPGNCPICGMDLVLVSEEDNNSNPMEMKDMDHKYPVINISAPMIQTIGVKTEKAKKSQFGGIIKTFGNIDVNQRTTYDISSRIEGWIEELNIKAIGDKVNKGDLIYKIYSPNLISAQKDYVNALQNGNRSRITSTGKHLIFLGLQSKTLEQIKKYRKALDKVPFYSETKGVIHHINVNQGSYVKPGMEIAQLQDYSSVWINAEIFGNDIKLIDQNNIVNVEVSSINKKYQAKIDYIHPVIDKTTKTNQVRLILDNSDGLLKPGDFANIEFKTKIKERLIIPSYAILKTTDSDHVILALGNGKFTKREVVSGISADDKTEIIQGLEEGDEVVTSSQFLIDSESSLKEVLSKLTQSSSDISGGGHVH